MAHRLISPQQALSVKPEDDINNNFNIKKENLYDVQTSILGTYYGSKLKLFNIVTIAIFHTVTVLGLIMFPYSNNWNLFTFAVVLGGMTGFGVTGGAHRLWTHRSYKAKLPLRIILMLLFSSAGQNTLYDWVRDHRVHHKFTETDADPHNAKRGFFFAHVGWLMMHKHPEVLRRGNEINMTDITNDPVVQFHQKHFLLLKLMMCFVIPPIIPPLLWGQDWFWSILVMAVGRYTVALNIVWLVNSAAHLWGKRPYDKNINPAENLIVSAVGMGEGWHNYHHTFPWDYRAAEIGKFFNVTTFWINVFAKIGWAYDLRYPSKKLVQRIAEKSGDGSHPIWGLVEVPESADSDEDGSNRHNLIKHS